MARKTLTLVPGRRLLITQVLPAGALACLACPGALAAEALAKTKAQESVGISYEQMFKEFYVDGLIPTLTALGDEVGRDKLVEMLKRAGAKAAEARVREWTKNLEARDLKTYTDEMRKPGPLYQHALTFEILEDGPTVFEARVTECLWAKTFRGAAAADIGYAYCCYPDTAAIKAFNPKIKATSSKTLMEGNDRCQYRLVLET